MESIKDLGREAGYALLKQELEHTPFAEVDFQAGDLVISFGIGWVSNNIYLTDLWALKAATNIILVSTVYDIIRTKLHWLFPPNISADFDKVCGRILEISDFVFTCSEQSANDIVDFCQDKKIATPPLTIFKLGDEPHSIDPTAKLQMEMLTSLKNKPFILFVSSIEVRKNHQLLINLWRRLINEHDDAVPMLVFLGRVILDGQKVVDILNTDVKLKNKILWLQGANDRTLNWLYEHCLFTVYPSLYEGWGLPVAESLMHGKLCIASNGGSLPEVAPNLAEYIDPLDFMTWYRALIKYCFAPQLLAQKNQYIRDNYKVTKWSDTAKQVLAALNHISQPKLRLSPLTIGKVINFTENASKEHIEADNFQLGGWGRREKSGSWTDGTRAMLGFQLDQQPTCPLALQVQANGYVPDNQPVQVIVIANGTILTRWNVGPNNTALYTLIPSTIIDTNCTLRIELLIVNPKSPMQFGPSNDTRLLGLSVTTVSLQLVTNITAVNIWNATANIDLTEYIIYDSIKSSQAVYLGLTIDTDKPAILEAQVDDKKICSFTAIKNKSFIKIIRYPTEILQQSNLFTVKILAKNAVRPRISQVGLFTQPPLSFLLELLLKHTALTQYKLSNGHVGYVGMTPTVIIGKELIKAATLQPGLVGGWHNMESHGVWTNGEPASIYVTLDTASMQHLIIGIYFGIYTWFPNAKDNIFIKIGTSQAVPLLDDTFVEFSNNGQQREFKLTLDEAIDATGRLAITFVSNGAIVPWDVGDMDLRPLAIRLAGITIQNAS